MGIEEQLDCQGCARCCINQSIVGSEREIAVIAEATGKKKDEFIEERFFQGELNEGYYCFILQLENADCFFLKKDGNSRFYCEIYTVRPKICQSYPKNKEELAWCIGNMPKFP